MYYSRIFFKKLQVGKLLHWVFIYYACDLIYWVKKLKLNFAESKWRNLFDICVA